MNDGMAHGDSGNIQNGAQKLHEDAVLIIGGGPVGLMVAVVLARYGVRTIVVERNTSTTKWPKMDLTNSRSMELIRRLGLSDDIRKLGVPDKTPYNVYFITGLHNSQPLASWEFPNVTELRKEFRGKNDGSSPQEPWQRISQAVFERYLKATCDDNPLIDCRFGWKLEKVVESDEGVTAEITQVKSHERKTLVTRYLVACDGASSRTRRDMEIPLEGGPIPGYALLVHFKSRDLAKLFKLGQFWHLFVFSEHGLHGAVICQDGKEIFTTHLLLPLDVDHESIDSKQAVYSVLGGAGLPFEIEIDEILVRSAYRHSVAVAGSYQSKLGRIFLAGDSAHQNVPTGGYGMNMGIGDAFDIGWKLASVINGHAGVALLQSYEQERRPIALKSVQRSRIHNDVHGGMKEFLNNNMSLAEEDSEGGRSLRQAIQEYYTIHNGENTDLGIEMDHRHLSIVYPSAEKNSSPEWDPSRYIPSTNIGSRAPHVLLKDGTSIFDYYGEYWTLVQFVNEDSRFPTSLLETAWELDLPLKHVTFRNEENARAVWEMPLVLVRPDGHVAWRSVTAPKYDQACRLLNIIGGWTDCKRAGSIDAGNLEPSDLLGSADSTQVQVQEYKLQQMGIMQQ